MINLNGISYLEIEEVDHTSILEPRETYFRCNITKDGMKAKGLGKTADQSFNDAIHQIRINNIRKEEIAEGTDDKFPF